MHDISATHVAHHLWRTSVKVIRQLLPAATSRREAIRALDRNNHPHGLKADEETESGRKIQRRKRTHKLCIIKWKLLIIQIIRC
jgi:hypothetical protein